MKLDQDLFLLAFEQRAFCETLSGFVLEWYFTEGDALGYVLKAFQAFLKLGTLESYS